MRLPPLVALLAVAASALSGCSSGGTGDDALDVVAGIDWSQALDVATTPSEPNELRGLVRVAWSDVGFAIESEREQDLAHRTIVTADAAYTTMGGMGWVRYGLDQIGGRGPLTNRLFLWDLRLLLHDPGVALTSEATTAGSTVVHAVGTLEGHGLDVDLTVTVQGNLITDARLTSPQGREAPFAFHPASKLSFPVAVPSPVKPLAEVLDGDARATAAHLTLMGLVESYADNHGGLLPERLDPDTLRLELLTAGADWPDNAYTGDAMADRAGSGGFQWRRCALTDGLYTGHGWDAGLVTQGFGDACPSAS
ncbi:MAG TPA: hypothetical protein VI796_04645 [Candidatus Thermoplasmatota archaeon]|nr:hypothetical protein [Candidatus Thermoplasmatota archaeon]